MIQLSHFFLWWTRFINRDFDWLYLCLKRKNKINSHVLLNLFPLPVSYSACSLELYKWYVKQKILLVSLFHRSSENKHIRRWAELMEHLLLDAHFCVRLMSCPCMYHLERGKKDLIKNKNSWFRFKFFFCTVKCRKGKWKGVICCDHWIE